MIVIRDLSIGYRKSVPVLRNLSLEIRPGEVVNILGPNGCGKTTLLKAILGFLPIPSGSVLLDDMPVGEIKRGEMAKRLAYVPQNHNGVFPYTVLDVALMSRTAHSPWLRFSDEDHRRAREALEKVRIGHLAKRVYLELSGGERQLVLVARALAQSCSYLVMDEPASGLDYGNQFRILDLIREVAESGLGVLLTTHHPEQALFLGGRALMMRDGKLLADGPVEKVISGQSVCELYGLSEATLERFKPLTTGV